MIFFKKKSLKDSTKKESDLQRVCNYPISSKFSILYSDKRFLKI